MRPVQSGNSVLHLCQLHDSHFSFLHRQSLIKFTECAPFKAAILFFICVNCITLMFEDKVCDAEGSLEYRAYKRMLFQVQGFEFRV
jgi:hypothetical protein